jgi:hypothetical protein
MKNRYWFQAKGLDFQDYQHSPIYRAHCATAKFMARILRERGERLNAWIPDNAASQFRMLKEHRSEGANALRSSVAKLVWSERKRVRQVSATIQRTPATAHSAYLAAHAEASRALACGEIRAFSVAYDAHRGRVIHYESHQGWMPEAVYSDIAEQAMEPAI